jgi:probable RNA-binding protein EIF1AD
VWIKRGDFVLVEPIAEGDKVKAEIVAILTSEHVKFFQANNQWPEQFLERKDNEEKDVLVVNANRLQQYCDASSSSSDSDEGSCSDDDEEEEEDDDDIDTQDT